MDLRRWWSRWHVNKRWTIEFSPSTWVEGSSQLTATCQCNEGIIISKHWTNKLYVCRMANSNIWLRAAYFYQSGLGSGSSDVGNLHVTWLWSEIDHVQICLSFVPKLEISHGVIQSPKQHSRFSAFVSLTHQTSLLYPRIAFYFCNSIISVDQAWTLVSLLSILAPTNNKQYPRYDLDDFFVTNSFLLFQLMAWDKVSQRKEAQTIVTTSI